MTLTDVRSPHQDKVAITRAIVPNRDLVYSPFTHSFISAVERTGNTDADANAATYVVCHHIRQFHASLRIAKLPNHGGSATAVAASQWHPCILAGNAQGTLMATNYLRKILPYRRETTRKATGAYMQTICEYDWRPIPPAGGAVSETAEEDQTVARPRSIYHGHDAREGISRFREGFKPEKIDVGTGGVGKSKPKRADTGASDVVFEEEQAVTVIEWNPNAAAAGLAAIGWGSGIIRVQDLAYDAD
jgi:hypothetical protein